MTILSDIRLPLRIKRVTSGDRRGGSFGISDAVGQSCGHFYFGPPDEVARSASRLLTETDAQELAKIAARAITARIEQRQLSPDQPCSPLPGDNP